MMKTINKTIFVTVLTVSATLAQANLGSADSYMKNMLTNTYGVIQRGEWTNPFMPEATGNLDTRVSADKQLTELVSAYSREMLDRGGWVNSVLDNADYASGNTLLSAYVGEGVTERRILL